MEKIFCAFLTFISILTHAQKYEGLALTPPMGWNSRNIFQTNIDEKAVMEMADLMVSSGLKDAGYTYLLLDDGWMAMERDNAGNLLADSKKFPRGIKVLSDYLHSKGLKIGLHNSAGTKTCSGFPGARGYEFQDARLYASWEIDFLDFGWCYSEDINPKEAYATMSKALRASGRPIVFAISDGGKSKPWLWAKDIAHVWKTNENENNCAGCLPPETWASLVEPADSLHLYAGPGHWNCPGLLTVGNFISAKEGRAQFSLWSMLAAPLVAGNDLRRLTKETLQILKNKEVIAINQDSMGAQSFLIREKDSIQAWLKPLKSGEYAFCLYNASQKAKRFEFNWRAELMKHVAGMKTTKKKYTQRFRVRNLWTKKSIGTTDKTLRSNLGSHEALLFRLTKW